MFLQIIDRIGSILGLTSEEALRSDLVKELCMDLMNGQLLILHSDKKKFSSIEIDWHTTNQSASQEDSLLSK
ncbi:MAG: hypothetical protein VX609_09110 [Verrucomicrobiota bacterium]|nr:hypothetical protein [Verrucomicrobiota bacterium]